MLWISIIQNLHQIRFQSLTKMTAKSFWIYLFIYLSNSWNFAFKFLESCFYAPPKNLISENITGVPPTSGSYGPALFLTLSRVTLNKQEQQQPQKRQRKGSSYFVSILLSLYTNSPSWTKYAKIRDKTYNITKRPQHSGVSEQENFWNFKRSRLGKKDYLLYISYDYFRYYPEVKYDLFVMLFYLSSINRFLPP